MKHIISYILLLFISQSIAQKSTARDSRFDTVDRIVEYAIDSTILTIKTDYDSVTQRVSRDAREASEVKIELVTRESEPGYGRVVLALLSVLFGILLKEIIDRLTRRARINKQGKRWIAEFEVLSVPLIKQIEALNKFKSDHAKNSFDPERLVLIQDLDGTTFDSLDKNELTVYIKQNCVKSPKLDNAVKLSNSITGFIVVTKSIQVDSRQYWDSYQDGVSKLTSSFDNSFKRFRDAYRKYSVETETEPAPDVVVIPYQHTALEVIGQYYKEQIVGSPDTTATNPFSIQKAFYRPSMRVLAALRRDIRTHGMVQAIVDGQDSIKGLQRESQYIERNVDNLITRFTQQLRRHEKLVAKLKTKS